jgi:hypothetical protein
MLSCDATRQRQRSVGRMFEEGDLRVGAHLSELLLA